MSSKIAFIDADFLVYSVGFTTEEDSEHIAKARLTEWLENFVYVRLQCDDYVAWITGKGNFRYDLAKTVPYKGNRKDAKKPKHYEALRNHLVKRHEAIETTGYEADDAVGMALTENPEAIICHVDKDLDQLPGKHFNPNKDLEYEVTEFEGLRNFYTQLLTGDRVDNIQGLMGIGPKKAEKALQECTTENELMDAVWKMYQDKNESWERLLENGRLLFLWRFDQQKWSPPSSWLAANGKST